MTAFQTLTRLAVACAAIALLKADEVGAWSRPSSAVFSHSRPSVDTTKRGLTLTPARAARFTTSRGTWMSVDVSPDGQTIVFDLLGDLYTLPIAGGTATRLTSGMGFDAQPRFSPDGKRIAFMSDRSGGDNVWVMSSDGRDSVQISHSHEDFAVSPEWTPDGKYVVVSKGNGGFGTPKLWLYDVSGGNGIQMTRGPGAGGYFGAAFGPEGRYVYYGRRTGLWQYNAAMPQFQVWVYDRETATETIMSQRYGSGFRPAAVRAPRPDSGFASWRAGWSAGWPIRSSATTWRPFPIST
jgi:Tol biopolymer transport system component